MQISLKTSGLLKKYLPDGTDGNTASITVPDGSNINGVLKHLGAPVDGNYLIVVNGESVPPSKRGDLIVSDGDNVSLMPPLKGG